MPRYAEPTASPEVPTRQSINLDDLQEQAEKLVALLRDRQPGLISWHMFLAERLKNLRAMIS